MFYIHLILFLVLLRSSAIDEWKSGRHETVLFRSKTYIVHYWRYLKTLQQWKEFMAKEHDLATELQQSLLRNARYAGSLHFMAHWDSLSN